MWIPEDSLGCYLEKCNPPPLKQDCTLAWSSPKVHTGWPTKPRNPPVSASQGFIFAYWGINPRFFYLLNETLPQFSPSKDSHGYTV